MYKATVISSKIRIEQCQQNIVLDFGRHFREEQKPDKGELRCECKMIRERQWLRTKTMLGWKGRVAMRSSSKLKMKLLWHVFSACPPSFYPLTKGFLILCSVDHKQFQSWKWNILKIIPRSWSTLGKSKLPNL